MKKAIKISGIVISMIMLGATKTLAAGGADIGVNASQYLSRNVTALFPVALAVIAIICFVKREFTRFIGVFVFAILVAICVYLPDTVVNFSKSIGEQIFK